MTKYIVPEGLIQGWTKDVEKKKMVNNIRKLLNLTWNGWIEEVMEDWLKKNKKYMNIIKDLKKR